MRGSILVKYNETPDTRGLSNFEVLVNSIVRDLHFTDINNYYSTFMFVGDVVRFNLVFPGGDFPNLTIYRKDYTTNDEAGDNGIKETLIPFTIVSSTAQLLSVQFTGSTVSEAYNFKYIIDCSSGPLPTFYTWSLGYNASTAQNACIDYTQSPSTYYTTVPTLQNGIYLYDSNTIFDLSPAGFYSDGTNVWFKSASTLTLTNQSACVFPTPTPTVTPILTDCLTTQFLDFSGFTGTPPYVTDGNYNVLNSYTGGTLNYGYMDITTGIFQPNAIHPNGNKYKVYGYYDGSFFYYNWFRTWSPVDVGWTIVRSSGGYFINGFGIYENYGGAFSGVELTNGTYYYLPSGTYLNTNLTGSSVTISCVSITPTPTPTPTVTPTPICNNELTYTNISTSGETTLNYIGPGWYQDYGFFPGWQTGIAPDGNNYGSYASVGFFQRIAKRFVRVGGIPLAFDWQMPFGNSNSNEQDLIDGIIYPGTGLTNTVITVTNVTIC